LARHEYFEELCTAASIGQATGEELVELEQHVSVCDACRQAYFQFLNVASQEFAAAKQDPILSPQEAHDCLDSELFCHRFFERAEQEGIRFSRDVNENVDLPAAIPFHFSRHVLSYGSAAAVAIFLFCVVLGTGGYLYWRNSADSRQVREASQSPSTVRTQGQISGTESHPAQVTASNPELQHEIDHLNGQLRTMNEDLVSVQNNLKLSFQERQRLITDRDALESELRQLRQQLPASQALVADAQRETTALRNHASDMETTQVADQIRLHELEEGMKQKSAELEQEHRLLSLGQDVTNLMGARNLHIVDVVDTDSRGKTQRAFGRVFFTEGKSLIFYAYDLNEQKIEKANYQYQVWAKKEGQDQRAQRLGIFFSDDKAQRRWVFKCDDPKLLRDIDSVFVTLGRPGPAPSHPEGSSLMYAYLRGQANHP
jgi:myosin heavy subunit